jgi:DNA polymerase III alpha subunit
LVNPSYNLTDAPEWLASVEESLLGIPLTCTSLDACDTSAANCSCLEYTQNVNPKVTIIAAKIDGINEIKVKSGKNKGQKMAFLKISDLTSNIDNVVIFSDVWTEAKKIAFVDNNILLHGERSKDGGSLVVRRIWQI